MYKFFLVLLSFSLLSCAKKKAEEILSTTIKTPDFSLLTPTCFLANNTNPQLTRDTLLSGSDWNDPSVLKINGQYVMYASSDQNFNFNISIYRMVSSNGLDWSLSPSTPVLSATNAAWDHRAVETPSVVFFQNKYHMFYTGYPLDHTDAQSYKIGHAISDDGITWTKDSSYIVAPTDPLGSVNMDFNQFITAEPAAVVFKDKIYLYFSAVGANAGVSTTLQTIGLVTSSDGTSWSSPVKVLEPSQSLFPRSTWLGYSTPNAVVLNNQLHLFFDVVQATPWKQLKLHHAYSVDGETSWSTDSTSIFLNTNFSWTSNEIRSPSLLLDDTELKMWFAGDSSSILGIGTSSCQL